MVIFHALIKHGGFTSAAKSLNVSVSHISKQIASLEDNIGIKLVQRTTRSLTLTEAGEVFYQHCEQLFGTLKAAQMDMESQRDDVSGKLRVGISQSFGTLHVIPAIDQLRQLYPQLKVEIHLFDYKVDMIEERLDLWITNNEELPEGYIAQRLADSQFVVAASPDYLIKAGTPSCPSELSDHNCLIYRSRERDYTSWAFDNGQESLCVTVSGDYSVDLAEAVRDAAVAGWGIAYLATYLIKEEFRSGQLIQVLPEWKASQIMPFFAVYPSRKNMPKKLSKVIEFLKQHIGSPTYWDKNLKTCVELHR
ncbi:LysR family transcriptional regulator [Vibrio fortis]|uniref:LysR family transcriptional regulator n=1 Tax=Vibrio fortis TaxID=212667 RepID=A0A5N3SCY5_9VIBR|nr:LysR family transcriptional regulator [Vibrio fortis]KAB0304758.1 LysR family transcriptional regulator [Vibrio fortis]